MIVLVTFKKRGFNFFGMVDIVVVLVCILRLSFAFLLSLSPVTICQSSQIICDLSRVMCPITSINQHST